MIGTVAALLGVSTIVAAYGWRRCHVKLKSEEGWCAHWKRSCEEAFVIYADDRRKRLEAEQAHTDLADKHNAANTRIENVISLIDGIPHRKGKEALIKAMLRGEAA